MKCVLLCLATAVLFESCNHKHRGAHVTMETVPEGAQQGAPHVSQSDLPHLRRSEAVKSYPLGRYVDGGAGNVMHERHTIYRLEDNGGWNLQGYPVQGWTESSGARDSIRPGVSSAAAAGGMEAPSGRFQAQLTALAEQNSELEKINRALQSRVLLLQKTSAALSESTMRSVEKVSFRKEAPVAPRLTPP